MKITGIANMKSVVAQIERSIPKRAAAALYTEGEDIMSAAKPRTPVGDSGILRGSG